MLEVAAEPTRRRLLQLLASGRRHCHPTRVAVFSHPLGDIAASVGPHRGRSGHRPQAGRERYYRLDERGVLRLRALFESFWTDELDRLVAGANQPQKETPP